MREVYCGTSGKLSTESLKTPQLIRVSFKFSAAMCLFSFFQPAWSSLQEQDLCHSAVIGVKQEKLGRLGIGVLDIETGATNYCRGTEHFPMQSVFKLPVAIAVLDHVDNGLYTLEQSITLQKEDLSVLYSPLAESFRGPEQSYTVKELLTRMIQDSDNTACDVLMHHIGGPKVVTETLKRHGIEDISVDRYERELQPEIFGLQPMKLGHAIDKARWERKKRSATGARAHKAFSAHISGDKRDTSTPQAMLDLLHKLYLGKLLTPSSTKFLLDTMAGTKTGTKRLRAALPAGSTLAHKTGTGPDLDGINSATNDVGIVTLPNGHRFAIVVFLTGSSLSEEDRESAICNVCRYVVNQTK